MPLLNLTDFERDALQALTTFATIPCLSPGFDTEWVRNGHIDRAIELLSDWALARTLRQLRRRDPSAGEPDADAGRDDRGHGPG